jgi:hypothetical protein
MVLYLQAWLFHLFLGIVIAVLLWCTWILINSMVLYLQTFFFSTETFWWNRPGAERGGGGWGRTPSASPKIEKRNLSRPPNLKFWIRPCRLHQQFEKYKIAIVHSYTPDVSYVKYRQESIRTNGNKVQSENTGMTKNDPCHCNKTNSVDGCKTACTLLST